MADETHEQVAEALDLLGAAWRSDWSHFDGRTLRSQLGDLSAALRGEPFDLDGWADSCDICVECRGWRDPWLGCTHRKEGDRG